MEELGIRPTVPIVTMVGNVLKELGMMDKYKKLKKKYPPPKWEYRYMQELLWPLQNNSHGALFWEFLERCGRKYS